MITPRQTRLHRVPDLHALRTTLTDWILTAAASTAGDIAIVVPTRAAAEQLRRTVEDRALGAARPALWWPRLLTRRDLYDQLAARMAEPPELLTAVDREVIIAGLAREAAEEGVEPPFHVRPSLIAEIVGFYDQFRRLGRTVEDFERNFSAELEPEEETDRGAARLLQQTRFLAAVYRRYEERLATLGRVDEHVIRTLALRNGLVRPIVRVVLTVADHLADPDGLWPADFDLLTRLPGLGEVDIVTTEAVLAAGLLERLHATLPELHDAPSAIAAAAPPVLVVPRAGGDDPEAASLHRDREEELVAVARRLKAERHCEGAAALHRTAIVVRRPLPYLYLARSVFADAGIAFEALDTLPLAAEPYAAAVDLALDAAATGFPRTALLALVRSPHFSLRCGLDAAAIAAFDHALAGDRYLGDLDRLRELIGRWEAIGTPASRDERRRQAALPVAHVTLAAAAGLAPLAAERLMIDQLQSLGDWLHRHEDHEENDEDHQDHEDHVGRRQRVRAATLGALAALGRAYSQHDAGARGDANAVAAALRRWLGARTIATSRATGGLQIVDAQAARFGDFEDVQIVGLIDGEWPERGRRSVLYPSTLTSLLEPLPAIPDPSRRERETLQAGRAAFKDLLFSPARRVRLSTFTLENDGIVEPSLLLDEVSGFHLPTIAADAPAIRVSHSEALALEPRVLPPSAPHVRDWASARLADDRSASGRGSAGPWQMPRVSVSRLERYLDCPFRFYASEVLGLEEQPEDEDTRTPLERGRFLHELWERFFAEWQGRGRGRINRQSLPDARALFEQLCEDALSQLPPSEAVLERSRLLGSAVGPGIAHRVFDMEARRDEPIAERLLEFPLRGDFTFRDRDGRTRSVTLSGKADRIDVLANGTLRIIDYKSKKTPDLKQALQLPIYSYCARERLRARDDAPWTIAEALYLSFEGERAVVALRAKGQPLDELLDQAQDRLLTALDRIAAGEFPASPARRALCGPCPYRTVCRLEIVEARAETADE